MKVSTRYSVTLVSLSVCLIFMAVLFLLNYVSGYQTRLGLSFIEVGFHFLTLVAGALLLVLGFIKPLRIKNTILYNFIGTFDSFFGLIGLLLFIFQEVTESLFLVTFLASFIIGLLLLSQLYLPKKVATH